MNVCDEYLIPVCSIIHHLYQIEMKIFIKRHTSSFFAPNFHVDVNDLRMRTYKGFVVHLFHSRKLNASFSQQQLHCIFCTKRER